MINTNESMNLHYIETTSDKEGEEVIVDALLRAVRDVQLLEIWKCREEVLFEVAGSREGILLK